LRGDIRSPTMRDWLPLLSIPVYRENSFGKCFGCLLRHVVTDAFEDSVRVFARESSGIGFSVRGRAVEIAGNGDRGHSDDGRFKQFLFQIVVPWLAFSQAQPPAVIMNDDADVIRVVEGSCCAIERSIVEVPRGRGVLPDQLIKFVPVFCLAEFATLRSKIVLIPPTTFSQR